LIIEQLERVPADEAAECAGTVAYALARAGHVRSQEVLGLAFRLALSEMPEGDADETRKLVATALASEGRVNEAIEMALACTWWHCRILALLAIIRAVPADADDRPRAADLIGELLTSVDDTFLDDAVLAACEAVRELCPSHVGVAARLLQAVELAY